MNSLNVFDQKKAELSPGTSFSGFAGQNLMITHLHFKAGAVGSIHAHPHEQLTLVLQGEITFTLNDERRLLKTGDVVAIPSNIPHGVFAQTDAEVLDIFTPIREDLMAKLNG